MANNYNLWAQSVSLDTPEESDWMYEVLFLSDESDLKLKQEKLIQLGFNLEDIGDCTNFPNFDYQFHKDEVTFYADEHSFSGGDIEHLIEIMKVFLSKFDPEGYFSLTWASVCSKMRSGEFGGGCLFVTANDCSVVDISSIVRDYTNQHKKEIKNNNSLK